MADESETLLFRLRVIAENLGAFRKTAAAAEDVNKSMQRATKLADQLAGANKRLNLVRDKEADALGKVRIAETKVNEVRGNAAAKTSQIAAAEERLLKARRDSARASSDVSRIEQEFSKIAEKALAANSARIGQTSGKNFTKSFNKSIKDETNNITGAADLVGRSFAGGIGNGLSAALRTQAGPLILGVLIAAVAVAAPAIGAVLAGGVVAGFGAGITALPIVFAAKSDAVRAKWAATMSQMGRDMELLSQPFESVLIRIADIAARTFNSFSPILKTAFSKAAVPIETFVDQVGRALEGLIPTIDPITTAFNEMLISLGPALQAAIKSIATGLTAVAESVRKNPTALADMIEGVGKLTNELLQIIAVFNNADGAFRRMTGGTSLVTVTFEALTAVLSAIATPLILVSKYIEFVSRVLRALQHDSSASGASMAEAGKHINDLAEGFNAVGRGAKSVKGPLQSTHEIAKANAAAAAAAAKAFEDWITQLFKLQGINMTVAQSQLALKESITQATESIKENGRGFNLNTKAGQQNQSALLGVARAVQAQTEANIRAKQPMTTVAVTAGKQRESFIKLAIQMGKTPAQAKKMADALISIPNVSRTARLLAVKKDLDAKLAAAKRQLADPNLTKERKAKLNADKTKLEAALKVAQAKINALKGKVVPITYTSNGITLGIGQTIGTKRGKGAIASGGKILGPGGDTSDRAGVFALSNREWVIKSKSSQKYGDYAMASVNAGTATVIPGGGMASGGRADVNIHTNHVFASRAQGMKMLADAMGGPALAWAKSQAGKPYIWGGVGPGGYDCSGFMSAIVNVIRGRNPHSRLFATGSLPGVLFQKGSGRFNVGWFKGNPGHMAGTLNGVPVESRGGRGVVVGAGARGAGDRLFNSGIWHLRGYAGGGRVGDPPYDGFGKWLKDLIPSYAQGTPYVPSTGLAMLHRGERVTPAGDAGKFTFEFKSDGSPYMEWLVVQFRKYIRAAYEGDVQKALGSRG